MAEQSYFWNTSGTGDGTAAGYARDKIAAWLKNIFSSGIGGILDRVGNELEVTGTSSPLAVDTGAAIVDGFFYYNTASANITVSTPSSGLTGGRVVLRADWSAQTVRIAVVMNTDGNSSIPALTQTSGTTYEINLAYFQITTGGVIDLTTETGRAIFASGVPVGSMIMSALSVLGNANAYALPAQEITAASDGLAMRRSGTSIGFGTISTAGIADGTISTAKILDEAIDDTKLGNRVPQFYRRQGGSESNWGTPGETTYTPGQVIIMAGVARIYIQWYQTSGSATITLPVSVNNPLILLSFGYCQDDGGNMYYQKVFTLFVSANGSGQFTLNCLLSSAPGYPQNLYIDIPWLIIGPAA